MNPNFFSNSKQFSAGNERGMVMVGVIAVMVFIGLFSAVATSFIATSGGLNNNTIQSVQALAIANAGSQWYLKSLQNDTDWTDEADQTLAFAEGRFEIQILSASAVEVSFKSTGIVSSALTGIDLKRWVSLTAQKTPSVFKFALFQGVDASGHTLELDNSGSSATRISGSMWAPVNVRIRSPNQVTNGFVYVPDDRDVTGSGTYVKKLVPPPYLTMPVFDSTSYTNLMDDFDSLLAANTSNVDLVLNSTLNVSGIMNYRSVTTTGSAIFKGSGTVVAKNFISLHGSNGLASGTSLKIEPDAGEKIEFVTEGPITVGSNNNNPAITNTENTVLYSQSITFGSDKILVRGSKVNLSNAEFYSRIRIDVRDGADIGGNSLLFVDNYTDELASNFIDIKGDANVTTVSGSIIAISSGITAVRLIASDKADLVMNGLVFVSGTTDSSACAIQNVTVNGSVVCDSIKNDKVRGSDINYQQVSNVPKGFESTVTVKDNSWDGY